MRIIIQFILVFVFISNVNSQGWEWQNPSPQGNPLYSSWFFNPDYGFMVGDIGTIMKTTDGGGSWNMIKSNATEKLLSVHFVDMNIGYIAGEGASILKTVDGGDTWLKLNCSDPQDIFTCVYFINEDIGFVSSAYGRVFKTIDGGETWVQHNLSNHSLQCVKFFDSNNGIIVGDYGKIYITEDGGNTWDSKNSQSENTLRSCTYLDSNTIMAVGSMNTIVKSIDGGNSWSLIENLEGSFMSIEFSDLTSGYIVGMEGVILKSQDGGNTWQAQSSGITHDLFSVFLVSETAYVLGVGTYPAILKSTNGGGNWMELSNSESIYPMATIHFCDEDFGYAASYGNILRTENGGQDWIKVNDDGVDWHKSMFCQNQLTAYAAGYSGFFDEFGGMYFSAFIKKTTDGGATWDSLAVQGTDFYNSVFFANENDGFAVGTDMPDETGNGIILKTNNGGLTWEKYISSKSVQLNSVFCTSNSVFAVGYDLVQGVYEGIILRSSDGGISWESVENSSNILTGIHFPNDSVGYTVGSHHILKTIDYGITWDELEEIEDTWHNSISFVNANTGFVAGRYGRIFKTLDGGINWFEQWSKTKNELYSIDCIDEHTAYVSGHRGIILKTSDGGGPPIGVKDLPFVSNSLKVFPNPATNLIKLETPLRSRVFIVNLGGSLMLSKDSSNEITDIDITSLPKGVYIVEVVNKLGAFKSKFIKQ